LRANRRQFKLHRNALSMTFALDYNPMQMVDISMQSQRQIVAFENSPDVEFSGRICRKGCVKRPAFQLHARGCAPLMPA
jgi:hypothetical protein